MRLEGIIISYDKILWFSTLWNPCKCNRQKLIFLIPFCNNVSYVFYNETGKPSLMSSDSFSHLLLLGLDAESDWKGAFRCILVWR